MFLLYEEQTSTRMIAGREKYLRDWKLLQESEKQLPDRELAFLVKAWLPWGFFSFPFLLLACGAGNEPYALMHSWQPLYH